VQQDNSRGNECEQGGTRQRDDQAIVVNPSTTKNDNPELDREGDGERD
jgi:hypothetical protein